MFRISRKSNLMMVVLLSVVVFSMCCMSMVQANVPWEQIQKMLAEDGSTNDEFGSSVAISGNIAVIGMVGDDDNGNGSGSAYVFDLATGEQLFKLEPLDGAELDFFGGSVAVSGNRAVVGAEFDDDNGTDSGSAYVFDVTTGKQLFKLHASDEVAYDEFGSDVGLSGNLAVIGAKFGDGNTANTGSAYVFDVTTGQQLFKLIATDGIAGDYFGISVAIDGNIAVIGADHEEDDQNFSSGSAYVFDVTLGQQLFKLHSVDRAKDDFFGSCVAVNGSIALIGVTGDDDNGSFSGSAYLFDLTTGDQLFKLLASDGMTDDYFGISVAVSGNTAMIGALGDDDGNILSTGSVYVFDVATGQQLIKLIASDESWGDNFGNAVAFNGNLAVIGAFRDDDKGSDSGSAYLFQQHTPNLLTVSPDPLLAGQPGTFTILRSLPNERTWLLYSLDGLGNTYLRILNVLIDLSNPKIAVGPKRADINGDLEFVFTIPIITRPVDIWFQAVQRENATNFVATRVVP